MSSKIEVFICTLPINNPQKTGSTGLTALETYQVFNLGQNKCKSFRQFIFTVGVARCGVGWRQNDIRPTLNGSAISQTISTFKIIQPVYPVNHISGAVPVLPELFKIINNHKLLN